MIISLVNAEFVRRYPAVVRQPANTSPSAKFEEHPKLLTKTCIAFHRFTINNSTTNKNIKLACNQNLQKPERGNKQALKRRVTNMLGAYLYHVIRRYNSTPISL
jgi:hypothetical protein